MKKFTCLFINQTSRNCQPRLWIPFYETNLFTSLYLYAYLKFRYRETKFEVGFNLHKSKIIIMFF